MSRIKSNKIRLELNNKQVTLAKKHAGVARHAYNWALEICRNALKNKEEIPSAIDLHKRLVREVKSVNRWYYEVSKYSPQQSLRNLSVAYTNYFRNLRNGEIQKKQKAYINKQKKKNGGKIDWNKYNDIGKPKFKKKGINDKFYLEGKIVVSGNKIKLPKFGWVKMSENIKRDIEVKNVVISYIAGYYFVSFKEEFEDKRIDGIESKPIVGVDLGIHRLATLSTDKEFENPKVYNRYKRKLRTVQRKVNKRYNTNSKKQSNNYYKARKEVAKIYYKISCIRNNAIHQLTSYLVKNHSQIKIEDLNVSGMMKNHKLAGSIQDAGFYEFRRQLEYKTMWYGSKLIIADRYFPSSKMCSRCGNIKYDLKLSDRVYKCDVCGLEIDRDKNASLTLEAYEHKIWSAIKKDLKESGGQPARHYKKLVENQTKSVYSDGSMKQEANIKV